MQINTCIKLIIYYFCTERWKCGGRRRKIFFILSLYGTVVWIIKPLLCNEPCVGLFIALCVKQNQPRDRERENFHRHASSKLNLNSLASAFRSRVLWTVKYSFRHGLPSFFDIRYQVSHKNAPSLQWRDRTDASQVTSGIELYLDHLLAKHLYLVLIDYICF